MVASEGAAEEAEEEGCRQAGRGECAPHGRPGCRKQLITSYDRIPTGSGKKIKLCEVDGKARIYRERKGQFVWSLAEAAAASADVVATVNDATARRRM